MLKRRNFCAGLMVLSFLAGCGGAGGEMAKPTTVVEWPALTALRDPEITKGLVMTAMMGDIEACKKNASDPKLQELVDKFANEPIPSSYKTPAREAAKQKLVDAYKSLIAKAKDGGTADDIKTTVNQITAAHTEVIDPNLK